MKYLIYTFLVFTFSCVSVRNPSGNFSEYLSFGSIGGFQHSYKEYRIYKDGSLVKIDTKNENGIKMRGFSSKQTDQFFALVSDYASSERVVNETGQVTYFIKLIDEDKEKVSFVWNSSSSDIAEVQNIYDLLIRISTDRFPIM